MSRMLHIRKRIEKAFERSGHFIYRNRLKTLLLMLLVIGALVAQIPKLIVDTSQESLLHKNDPIRLDYNAFREQFGLDDMILIAITPPEVFDSAFLKTLKAFHEDLETEVPYLKEITSLINARRTYGEEDTLIVEDLLEGWPEEPIDLAELKNTVLSNPAYLNNYISEDGRTVAIVLETEAAVEKHTDEEILSGFEEEQPAGHQQPSETRHFLTGEESAAVVEALYQIIERYQSADFSPALAGTAVQLEVLKATMLKDMRTKMPLLILIIAVTLFLFFRRITGIVLPLIVVILSTLSTIGLMAVFKAPFMIPSQIIPSFLIAVGIGDSIHILAIFYHRFQEGTSKEDAIAYALGHSGLAVIMTSVTTAAGLMSFSFAQIAPVANMGLFCSAGVMLALLYTIILLPTLLALIPLKSKPRSTRSSRMDRVLLGFSNFVSSHPLKIVVVSLILLGGSIPLLFRVSFGHNVLEWLPDRMKVKRDAMLIDQQLKGATTLEVVLDTGNENGLYEPKILHGMETLSRSLENIRDEHIFVGKVFSINDILKESNQALHQNNPAYYTIPDDRDTIAQELFLFENTGSDDLERIVDSLFSKTRMTIKTPWIDAVVYEGFIEKVKDKFQEVFQGHVTITITGIVSIIARAVPASIDSAVKSYIIAFVVIAVMMILFVGGFKIGLYSLLPNFLPIFLILGITGLIRMPLDLSSIFLGSIAIGLVVDDTVHFIYNFRRYYSETGDGRRAVEYSLLGVGRAMLVTSIVLCSGFFIFVFFTMVNMQRFGGLIAAIVIIALLADFVVGPALMVLVTGKKSSKDSSLLTQEKNVAL